MEGLYNFATILDTRNRNKFKKGHIFYLISVPSIYVVHDFLYTFSTIWISFV